MKMKHSSTFDLPFEQARGLILQPSTMQIVASPILQFTPVTPRSLPDQWQPGNTYRVNLTSLGLIPLGWYDIRIEIEKDDNNICIGRDIGRGQFVNIWDHVITIERIDSTTRYTDSVDVHAGLFTPLVFLFAHFFYRHRQRRWKNIVIPKTTDRQQ